MSISREALKIRVLPIRTATDPHRDCLQSKPEDQWYENCSTKCPTKPVKYWSLVYKIDATRAMVCSPLHVLIGTSPGSEKPGSAATCKHVHFTMSFYASLKVPGAASSRNSNTGPLSKIIYSQVDKKTTEIMLTSKIISNAL
jgi:hypothetical protein